VGGTGSNGPVPLSQIECPICGEPTVVNAMGDGRLICSCASHYEINFPENSRASEGEDAGGR
jgi:hypothetical protein